MSLRDFSERQVLAQLAAARELGHELDLPPIVDTFNDGRKAYRWRCSCGWQSRPKPSIPKAFLSCMVHVGVVTGDGEAHPVTDPVPEDVAEYHRRVAAGLHDE